MKEKEVENSHDIIRFKLKNKKKKRFFSLSLFFVNGVDNNNY